MEETRSQHRPWGGGGLRARMTSRGSSPQSRWRRKRDYRGRMVKHSLCGLEQGSGEGDGLKNYAVQVGEIWAGAGGHDRPRNELPNFSFTLN